MRSLLKSKLKGVPEDQQEMILNAVEKNPELFAEIGKKIEQRIKNGESQTTAMMTVMREYQSQLQGVLKK